MAGIRIKGWGDLCIGGFSEALGYSLFRKASIKRRKPKSLSCTLLCTSLAQCVGEVNNEGTRIRNHWMR